MIGDDHGRLMRTLFRASLAIALLVLAVAIPRFVASLSSANAGRDASSGGARAPAEPQDEPSDPPISPLGGARVLDAFGVRWLLTRTGQIGNECLNLTATSLTTSDTGDMGGCGANDDPLVRVDYGGIEIDGEWFTLIFGSASIPATEVRVTTDEGEEFEQALRSGMWLIISPENRIAEAFKADLIELLGPGETVLRTIEPPLGAFTMRERAAHARETPSPDV
jgi:hypothetical protein